MSCRRYQEELSLNLDGRLPGARRAAVLNHVDTCARCAQVWDELQSTQTLLFDIEPPAVHPRFRDQVWERIRAGEGSPEVLLQEPISIGTKLRYGLVGAAAAALFVVGLQLVTAEPAPANPAGSETEVARSEVHRGDGTRGDGTRGEGTRGEGTRGEGSVDAEPAGTADLGLQADARNTDPGGLEARNSRSEAPRTESDARLRLRNATPAAPFTTPTLTAGQLASETVERVTSAARQLRLYRGRILGKQPLDKPHQQQVLRCVQTIEGGVFVLDRLQRKDLLVLESSSQECLAAARSIIRVSDAQSKVYNLVRTLDNCQLDRLNEISYKVKLRQFQEQADPLAEMLLDVGFRNMLKYVAPQRAGTMLSLLLQQSGSGRPIHIELVPSCDSWGPGSSTPPPTPEPREKRLKKRNESN